MYVKTTPIIKTNLEKNNILTQKKYDDLMKKLLDSKVSRGLEEEQKGEQFTLIQHANYPRSPYKPNRVAILLLGCFLGIGAGVGLVCLQEYLDHSIRDGDMLATISSAPVLGSIPLLTSEEDVVRGKKTRFMIVILVLAIFVGMLFAVNYYS